MIFKSCHTQKYIRYCVTNYLSNSSFSKITEKIVCPHVSNVFLTKKLCDITNKIESKIQEEELKHII